LDKDDENNMTQTWSSEVPTWWANDWLFEEYPHVLCSWFFMNR